MAQIFNPLGNNGKGDFDLGDDEVQVVSSASTTTNENFEIETSTGRIYYWYGGHRYYLGPGTLDDPSKLLLEDGSFILLENGAKLLLET